MISPLKVSLMGSGGCRLRRDPLDQIRRLAINQTTYDAAVDSLVDGETAVFACECSGAGCRQKVELTIPEYERVRIAPERFLVSPSCACIFPPGESLHEDHDRYKVVELARRTLHCQECPATAGADEGGWVAFPTSDKPPKVIAYCPVCAEREFGDR